MAMTQDFVIRLLADLKGAKQIDQALQSQSARLKELTQGQYALNAAGRVYNTQTGQTANVDEVAAVAKRGLAAEAANAVRTQTTLLTTSKRLAEVMGTEAGATQGASVAVADFNDRLARLTGGQAIYIREANRFVLANGQEATSAQVAAMAVDQLAREQAELAASTETATASLTRGQQAMLGTHMGMQAMSGAAGSASFAVLSLGQGFQDAGQFGVGMAQGIRAVTNNAQQAFQAFIMLRTITGSTGKAFMAFKQAMSGPGGILLAFGAITALIEGISNKMQKAKADAEKFGAAIRNLANINREFIKTFELSEGDILAQYDLAITKSDEYRDHIADLEAEKSRAASAGGGTGRLASAIQEELEATEGLLAISDGIIAAYKEEAKAIRDRNKQIEWFTEHTTETSESAALLQGAMTELQTKIADTAKKLETSLNPEIRKLRQELAMWEGALTAGLPFETFIANWDAVIDKLDAAGISADKLRAEKFAQLWAELGDVNKVFDAFVAWLKEGGDKAGDLGDKISDLDAAIITLQRALRGINDMDVSLGPRGLAEYLSQIELAEERTRQTLAIFKRIAEENISWQDRFDQTSEFIGMLEAAGLNVDNLREALGEIDEHGEWRVNILVKYTTVGEDGEEVTAEGLMPKMPEVIEVEPPEIKLTGPPTLSKEDLVNPLTGEPLDLSSKEWAEWYDKNIAEAEKSNERLMNGTIKMGQIMSQAFGGVGTSLMQLAKTGETVDRGMFETGKAFAIADAVINTAVGITRAYKDLPIWAAIPASAAIAAAGAAQIATIRAAQPGGGGSPTAKSITIGAAPQLVFGTSGNIGQFVDTGQSAASFTAVQAPGPSSLSVNVQGVLVGSGRDLVAVVREENEAQTRLGIQQPLGA